MAKSAEERFWSKVQKTDTCWIWTGCKIRGYGQSAFKGKVRGAHRIAYELIKGPIPDGLHLDHLCKNPPCVNPNHLEPVTPRENVYRSTNQVVFFASRTHCSKGHEYTPDNVRGRASRPGARVCIQCREEYNEIRRQSRRAARMLRS